MRLQLSLAVQNLPTRSCRGGVFAVVIDTTKDGGRLIGQTEVVTTTREQQTTVDWTKLLYMEDWELGQPQELIVTIYNTGKESVGSVLVEVGDVLGAPGSRLAQTMKNGGVVVSHVEEATAAGTLRFQLRGWNLMNMDRGLGIINKTDPFFELQRWHARAGVWDTVFRSAIIKNDLCPLWDESFVEVHALCGGRQTKQKFRLCLYDADANGKSQDMGYVLLTIDDMLTSINPTASASNRNTVRENPGFTIKKGNTEMGMILIVAAEVIGALPIEDDTEAKPPIEPLEDTLSSSTNMTNRSITDEDDEEEDIVFSKPTFVSYINGGCEMRVIVAIDATASNGDPRQEKSLHHFQDDGQNTYEEALFSLCSILSKYDSDQKYPVYAFGAKHEGNISHCFPVGSGTEVDGVAGILNAYRTTFRSGIIMSSPRNFSQIILKATRDANEQLKKGQYYSILLIFTNGDPADVEETLIALQESSDAPLSIVIVGVGDASFMGLDQLKHEHAKSKKRDNLQFVQYENLKGDKDSLSKAALYRIPGQLETFFTSKCIFPQPPKEPDEIAVEPYEEENDIQAPVAIDDAGQASVDGPVKVPNRKKQFFDFMALGMLNMKKGRQFMARNRRMIGQIKKLARKYLKF